MRTFASRLHALAEHPLTNLVVAAVLIVSSLHEAADDLLEPLWSGDIRMHHGMLLFGAAQVLRTLPEIVDGIERLFHPPDQDAATSD